MAGREESQEALLAPDEEGVIKLKTFKSPGLLAIRRTCYWTVLLSAFFLMPGYFNAERKLQTKYVAFGVSGAKIPGPSPTPVDLHLTTQATLCVPDGTRVRDPTGRHFCAHWSVRGAASPLCRAIRPAPRRAPQREPARAQDGLAQPTESPFSRTSRRGVGFWSPPQPAVKNTTGCCVTGCNCTCDRISSACWRWID